MTKGPPIPPRRGDERAYERALRRALLDPMHARTREQFARAQQTYESIREILRGLRDPTDLDEVATREARAALERISAWHKQRFQQAMRRYFGIRVDLMTETPLDLPARVRDNVNLIKTIPGRYHDSLQQGITRLQAEGPFDQQKLQQMLAKEYKSSGYNLRRITRDQTSKLVGQLNHARQTELGIERYEWVTAGDERVRPTHSANGGQIFRWDQPPETGVPGDDVQCRCFALAIFTAPAERLPGGTVGDG